MDSLEQKSGGSPGWAGMGPPALIQESRLLHAQAHMKLLIICLVSSELRELAKLMKEQ